MSLPVANAKLVPKKKPEAAALFKPYFKTPFTAAWYLSQAAFSLAKDRTYSSPHTADSSQGGEPLYTLGTCASYNTSPEPYVLSCPFPVLLQSSLLTRQLSSKQQA